VEFIDVPFILIRNKKPLKRFLESKKNNKKAILLSRAVVTALGVQHYVTIINKTECKYTSDTMP